MISEPRKSQWDNIQVVILTLNESKNIRLCLDSLPLHASVLIIDSGSSDDTIEIAQSFNNKLNIDIRTNDFKNYACQRNYALDYITKPYVLMIDADEIISSQLIDEIEQSLQKYTELVAMAFPRKNYLGNALIPTGKDYQTRLFRKGLFKYAGSIHETLVPVPKNLIYSRNFLYHYTYASIDDYAQKVIKYSKMVA
ncbi:MAG: glycosyltransferase family 2 protein, partial [Firmicutes bacterium]|nr:glycosyltransferase family 2 protein [Bacillota bacterium]